MRPAGARDVLAFLEQGAAPPATGSRRPSRSSAAARSPPSSSPKMAPQEGPFGSRAAAAIAESRLGGGSLYFRFTPGNLRFVDDFPGASVVVETRAVSRPRRAGAHRSDLAARLKRTRAPGALHAGDRRRSARATALAPHLQQHVAYGRRRGRPGAAPRRPRATAGRRCSRSALLVFLAAWPCRDARRRSGHHGLGIAAAAYVAAVVVGGVFAALRFPRVRWAVVDVRPRATHVAYALGFVRGLAAR